MPGRYLTDVPYPSRGRQQSPVTALAQGVATGAVLGEQIGKAVGWWKEKPARERASKILDNWDKADDNDKRWFATNLPKPYANIAEYEERKRKRMTEDKESAEKFSLNEIQVRVQQADFRNLILSEAMGLPSEERGAFLSVNIGQMIKSDQPALVEIGEDLAQSFGPVIQENRQRDPRGWANIPDEVMQGVLADGAAETKWAQMELKRLQGTGAPPSVQTAHIQAETASLNRASREKIEREKIKARTRVEQLKQRGVSTKAIHKMGSDLVNGIMKEGGDFSSTPIAEKIAHATEIAKIWGVEPPNPPTPKEQMARERERDPLGIR